MLTELQRAILDQADASLFGRYVVLTQLRQGGGVRGNLISRAATALAKVGYLTLDATYRDSKSVHAGGLIYSETVYLITPAGREALKV